MSTKRTRNLIAHPPHVVAVLARAGYKVIEGRAYLDNHPCTEHETRACEALMAAAYYDHGDRILARPSVPSLGGMVH